MERSKRVNDFVPKDESFASKEDNLARKEEGGDNFIRKIKWSKRLGDGESEDLKYSKPRCWTAVWERGMKKLLGESSVSAEYQPGGCFSLMMN